MLTNWVETLYKVHHRLTKCWDVPEETLDEIKDLILQIENRIDEVSN